MLPIKSKYKSLPGLRVAPNGSMTPVATGVIDPLGATLNPGKDLYFDLIGNMSKSFKGC